MIILIPLSSFQRGAASYQQGKHKRLGDATKVRQSRGTRSNKLMCSLSGRGRQRGLVIAPSAFKGQSKHELNDRAVQVTGAVQICPVGIVSSQPYRISSVQVGILHLYGCPFQPPINFSPCRLVHFNVSPCVKTSRCLILLR